MNSAMHDELIREIDCGTLEERIGFLLRGIADRIKAANANPVRLSDLRSILRENPAKLARTALRKNLTVVQ